MIIDREDDSNRLVLKKFMAYFVDIVLVAILIGMYIFMYMTGTTDKMETLAGLEKERKALEKEQKELQVNIEFLTSRTSWKRWPGKNWAWYP